jgi:ankyrin repeat protein
MMGSESVGKGITKVRTRDVGVGSRSGFSLLLAVVSILHQRFARVGLAKKLMKAGADSGIADKWGVTCLMWACGFSGDEELLSMLIGPAATAGILGAAFPKLPHYLDWTDLHGIADLRPKTAFMFAWKRWIDAGQQGDPLRPSYQRVMTALLAAQGLPLHAAVMLGCPPSNRFPYLTSGGDITQLEEALLHHGWAAPARERDDFGRTALALACYLGHEIAAERLAASAAAAGALDARDLDGITAMEYARWSFTRAVRDSIEARLYEVHELPLHAAVALGDPGRVEALLRTLEPSAVTAQEPCGRSTALVIACKVGCTAAAEALVSATAAAGAVDAADSEGMTAMMHASMRDQDFRGVMELLLQAGARPDLADARRGRNRCHFQSRALVVWGYVTQHICFA